MALESTEVTFTDWDLPWTPTLDRCDKCKRERYAEELSLVARHGWLCEQCTLDVQDAATPDYPPMVP